MRCLQCQPHVLMDSWSMTRLIPDCKQQRTANEHHQDATSPAGSVIRFVIIAFCDNVLWNATCRDRVHPQCIASFGEASFCANASCCEVTHVFQEPCRPDFDCLTRDLLACSTQRGSLGGSYHLLGGSQQARAPESEDCIPSCGSCWLL